MCLHKWDFCAKLQSHDTLRCLIKGEALISGEGRQICLFITYMKNSGEGGKIFLLLHEKQGVGVKISEIKYVSWYTLLLGI